MNEFGKGWRHKNRNEKEIVWVCVGGWGVGGGIKLHNTNYTMYIMVRATWESMRLEAAIQQGHKEKKRKQTASEQCKRLLLLSSSSSSFFLFLVDVV